MLSLSPHQLPTASPRHALNTCVGPTRKADYNLQSVATCLWHQQNYSEGKNKHSWLWRGSSAPRAPPTVISRLKVSGSDLVDSSKRPSQAGQATNCSPHAARLDFRPFGPSSRPVTPLRGAADRFPRQARFPQQPEQGHSARLHSRIWSCCA